MTDLRPLQTAEFDAHRSHRRALAALLGLVAFHVWATWGYTASFYAEPSAWMHEVERFAAGEVPYRDFDWPFPPLAIWVVGGAARLLGTDLAALGAITATIAVLMYLAYHRVVSRVAPGVGTSAVVTGFVFASAYAARYSPPLPMGGLSPGGSLGMLCLLAAVWLIVGISERPAAATAAGTGMLLGLAMLSRHDFWLPALFLLAWGIAALRHAPAHAQLRGLLTAGLAATFAAGAAIALATAGTAAFAGLVPHRLLESLLLGMPSLERLTIEVAAASALGIAGVVALWLCFALDDARAFKAAALLLLIFLSACAVHLGMSVSIARGIADHGLSDAPTRLEESIALITSTGRRPIRAAVYLLDQGFQAHLFPTVMPPILLGVLLLRWRRWELHRDRDLALLMLGLAVTLRARRGFSGADWPNVLVEIPAYALFLHLVAASAGRSAQRAVSMALAILFVVGLYTYYSLGSGPLTQRRYPALTTVRGTVHWAAGESQDYPALRAVLDSLDPQRRRPLLAFGPSGAWNYFFGRPSPTRFTRGFTSEAETDTVRAALRALPEPPLVVDTRAVVRITRLPRPGVADWENRPQGAAVSLLEIPHLGDLLNGCLKVEALRGPPAVPIYDCRALPSVTPRDSSP